LKSDASVTQLKNMVPVLVGAVVGFAGSLLGSLLVNRRDLVRTMRLRLYHELIPTAEKAVNDFLDEGLADDVPVTEKMLIVREGLPTSLAARTGSCRNKQWNSGGKSGSLMRQRTAMGFTTTPTKLSRSFGSYPIASEGS